MKEIRIGVIGVGHLGAIHAKLLRNVEGVVLAGVYDMRTERAETIATELGVPSFASIEELCAVCDGVSIATSTTSHYDVASIVIEQGKHLFLEKPITETAEQAHKLNRLAAKKNLLVQVGHIERFNPALLAVGKHELAPMFIESHRLAQFNPRGTDVSVVHDLMIHDIDLILSLVKSPVKKIDASGVHVISDRVDIANARLVFENGCVANVTASRISNKRMRKMRLFQKDTYISIDFSEPKAEIFYLADPTSEATPTIMLGNIEKGTVKKTIAYDIPAIPELNPLQHELSLFAQSIRTGASPIVSGDDGARALEVAEEIMRLIEAAVQ